MNAFHRGVENAAFLERSEIEPIGIPPYAATPLVVERQGSSINSVSELDRQIYYALEQAIGVEIEELGGDNSHLPGVNESALASTKSWIANRLVQQESLNSSLQKKLPPYSASRRLLEEIFSAEEMAAFYEKAATGIASPLEAHLVHLYQGAGSAEYASLTMGPRFNRNHEAEMWGRVQEIFDFHNVKPEVALSNQTDGISRTQVIGFDRQVSDGSRRGHVNHVGAMRILTKRQLGVFETLVDNSIPKAARGQQVTVKSRQYSVVNTRFDGREERKENCFPRELASEIIQAAARDEKSGIDAYHEASATLEASGFMNALRQDGLDSHLIIARNETIYGVLDSQEETARLRNLGKTSLK